MQEIQLYSNLAAQIDAIDRLGDTFAKSGMFRCTRVEQGRTIVVMCMTMGITPTEFIARYDLIDGVPRKKALACAADFRRAGGRIKWLTESDDHEKAVGEFTLDGQMYKVRFTIADAQRQCLSFKPGSNWVKTPSNMLRARVITTAIGMLAPEIVAGAEDDTQESTSGSPVPLTLGSSTAIDVPASTIEEPAKPAALPAPTQAPRVATTQAEEAELAEMGIAPAKTQKRAYSQAKAPGLTFKKKATPATIEPDAGEGPIPPSQTIEPDAPTEAIPTKIKCNPLIPPNQLSPETVEAMGTIFQGHFVEVANWMIKNQWIEAPDQPIKTEAHAAVHLQRTLPYLAASRAKRILTKKMAFMRAIEEIEP